MSKLIACIRINRTQGDLTSGSMVPVATPETLPVPLRTPGDNALGSHSSDDGNECSPQLHVASTDFTVRKTQEPNVFHSERCRSFLLLVAADAGNVFAWDARVIAADLTIGQHAVGHGNTGISPVRDSAAYPELGVVRVGNDYKYTLNFMLS